MSRTRRLNENRSHSYAFGASAATRMLNIDIIREKIVHYAIHDKMGKISPKTVKNVRLVQKSWLDSANLVLQKSEETAITLNLDEANSLSEAEYVRKNKKLLDQFTARFSSPTALLYSRIPVKLILNVTFFQMENFNGLMDFLKRCGEDLKELEVIFPRNGGTMPVGLPGFTLPLLRKLKFNFSNDNSHTAGGEGLRPYGDNRNGLWFLQGILNAGMELKSLCVPFVQFASTVPEDFQFIHLPETISSIDLLSKLSSAQLQVLVLNQFSNLSRLEILVHEAPFEEDLLFKILQRLCKTLTNFCIRGLNGTGHERPQTIFRLPVMEKLTTFQMLSGECKLESENLPRFLPKLTRLLLLSTAEKIKTNWIVNSKFEHVNYMSVSCISEYFRYGDEKYFTSLGIGMMSQLHTSFPNVQHLILTVNISNLSGLSVLFKHMIQLKYLFISLAGNLQDSGNSSDRLDSVLLGLPLNLVNVLREYGDVVEPVRLRQNHMQPSIRNLLELRTLELAHDPKYAATNDTSLISTLLFNQGFLKMPKLRNLRLRSKFKLNDEMRVQWADRGFSLIYVDF